MKLLLIREQGRAAKRRSGGIYRSGIEIVRVLRERGWAVETLRDKSPITSIPKDVDVVWHYGAYNYMIEAVELCTAASIPIIVTSSFTNGRDIAKLLNRWWAEWGSHPLVFFGLWSHLPMFDSRIAPIAKQTIMLPKTLRQGAEGPPLKDRSGIALGDLTKLQMGRVMSGFDFEQACARLREEWPDEPLLCFQQHTPLRPPPPGVTLVPYQKDLLSWLSKRKLFISMVSGETYAMVPMEAQSVGTPVLYRHQPQSLSQTIGQTGILFRDIDDMIDGARFLLDDESAWSAFSQSGRHNSAAHQHYGVGMDLALRSVIKRSQR